MPKRMLDDSLLTSASLAKCSPRAQDAFPRFILLADDFGCFEVIPRALAATGWVYRHDVSEGDMVAWLEEFVGAGMACLWTENERRYCYLIGWDGPHGQRRRAEYDPNAPKGSPGAHGSKRRTPRPPVDLVEAVKAGLRRDRDGKPPGVDGFPPGNAAGNDTFPPGNAAEAKPSKITPAREFAGDSREIRGSAAPVPVPVPVPDPVPAAAGSAAGSTPPPGIPTKAAHLAKQAPNGQALIDALAAAGWTLTHASVDRRARLEQALATEGVPAALLAHVIGDLEDRTRRQAEIVTSVGFYLGEASTLAQRTRIAVAPTAAPSVPILDLAWLDQLPEPRRAEAHAAWESRRAEVESSFQAAAVPRVLASTAEALRLEFAS